MFNRLIGFALALGLVLALSTDTFAGVRQTITYQGRLTDGSGLPVPDAPHPIEFRLYNMETGGLPLWENASVTVSTIGGLFSYELGSSTPIPESLFIDTSIWLGITIPTNSEMVPRIRLSPVPYSHHSSFADSAGITILPPGSIGASAVDPNQIQLRVTGSSPPGAAITSINSDGTVGTSAFGSITGVTAGTALTGGGTTGNVTLGVAPNSIGSVEVGDNSLGAIDLATNSVGADEIAQGAVGASEVADNSIGSADITNNSILDADISSSANIAPSKISGTAVNLSSTQTITGQKTFSTRTFFGTDVQIAMAGGVPLAGVKLTALGLSRFGSATGAPSKQIVIPAFGGSYIDWDGDFWQVNNQGGGAGGFNWRVVANAGTSSTPPWDMRLFGGSLTVTGNMHAVSFQITSDLRFKKDIRTLAGALENVIKLRGVYYRWRKEEFPKNDFSNNPQIGFIAQEVQAIYPEFVGKDEEGYLSVDYSHLTPVLVEAIKEQQKLIEDLQKQVAAMQDMRTELTEVKAMVQRLSKKPSDDAKTYSTK